MLHLLHHFDTLKTTIKRGGKYDGQKEIYNHNVGNDL